MKKFVKPAIIAISCLAVLLSSGCANGKYQIYTNMPEGSFEITDSSFELGGIIDGYEERGYGTGFPSYEGFTTRTHAYYTINGSNMGSDAYLSVSADFTGDGQTKYENFTNAVATVLNAVNNALSTSVPDSDVNKFNEAPAGEKVEITKITYEVLQTAKAVYELTEGYYNPALYYNVLAYGFSTPAKYPQTSADLPKDGDIAKYTELSKEFSNLVLSAGNGKYYALKPEKTVEVDGKNLTLKLDLGGIGKGYAVDMVNILYNDYGYYYGNFNFGMSSMLVKFKLPDENSPLVNYSIGFESPRPSTIPYYLTTNVMNTTLSTSGDNKKYYRLDGQRYCHIIDKDTGKPVQKGIMSVTVIGGSAAEADALTTAIMAMGKERAKEFIETKLTDREVAFVTE